MPIFVFLLSILLGLLAASDGRPNVSTSSRQSSAEAVQIVTRQEAPILAPTPTATPAAAAASNSPVCAILKQYPKAPGEPLSFERGEVSALCRPFVKKERAGLDRCGDTESDPYASPFTWASRTEMYRRGKVNIVADPAYQSELELLLRQADQIRGRATDLCCQDDASCRQAMTDVDISICQPSSDPNSPDPCVFGGYYQMTGSGYSSMFRAIHRQYTSVEGDELKKIAAKNLSMVELERLKTESGAGVLAPFQPVSGRIVLSSYVSKDVGVRSMEPTLNHEFGHACSMIKMQKAAISGATPDAFGKAVRATQWLDKVKDRCSAELELPEAYYDFWESLGESRELAACLYRLTEANQKQKIDRPCEHLCPGHYLEESVGIAFSMLNGDLSGIEGAVYPNTCDHVRDGQHPMVGDVVDCLAQNSPRFRERLRQTYRCGT